MRRYPYKACSKTFNTATAPPCRDCTRNTGSSPSGDVWQTDGLSEPRLGAKDNNPPELKDSVEVDGTYVLANCKGDRKPVRKHRRNRKACKRRLSNEQAPMFVAVDWSGTTACTVLSSVMAENLQTILEPKVEDHSILVTDAENLYLPWPRSLGVKREALNLSSGESVRDVFRIQTVNRLNVVNC